MSDDKWNTVEDWIFEGDDRFLLGFSRMILCFAVFIGLLICAVFTVIAIADFGGEWLLLLIGATLVVSWVHWTLTGGKPRHYQERETN